MTHLQHFSVQWLSDTGEPDNSSLAHVEATSAIAAGEAVTGEPLAVHGTEKRVIVWRLSEDLSPVAVTLFRKEPI